MIISKKKDFQELMKDIGKYKSFFLIGCAECASLCGTGGDTEIKEMSAKIEDEGKTITGKFVAKTVCQELGTKVELKKFKQEVDDSDCILVMSCGAGTQTVVEIYKDKAVYSTNDSLFLGNMTRFKMFDERCSLCGECIINKTGGICPVTTCPKGLLNGPCGGCIEGNCEVTPDRKCAWVKIYERMKRLDMLQEFCKITLEAKDWSKTQKPRNLYAMEE